MHSSKARSVMINVWDVACTFMVFLELARYDLLAVMSKIELCYLRHAPDLF